MSDVNRRIITTFQAVPGNVRAVMADVTGSLSRVRRETRALADEQGYLNRQMRAFGTTARYAVAGGAVFGAVGGVSQLSNLQQQLGLMSAIGTLQGNQLLMGERLRVTGEEAERAAVRTLTPINEMNDAVINLLSTVQDVKRPEIVPIMEQIARGSKIAEINLTEATKAFTTMNTAFGRETNLKNITSISEMFSLVTRQAPGGRAAGQQAIQQLGQISTMYAAIRGTPEQMFGHLLALLRGGIPPAQAGRGLAFMIQTLAFPGSQVKESQEGLRQAGVTPQTVSQLGPHGALMAVFREAQRRGIRGDLRKFTQISDEEMADIAEGGKLGRDIGVSGPGLTYLANVFRRIHALRTAVAIFSRLNPPQGQPDLSADLNLMIRAQNNQLTETEKMAAAWKRFHDESNLAEAARAVEKMRLDVVQAFEPALNYVARGISRAGEFVADRPKETAFTGLGLLGLWGVASRVGRGRRIPGVSRGLIGAQAVTDVLEGAPTGAPMVNIGAGYSIMNPLYVTVVGQVFGGGRGTAPIIGPTGPANTPGNRPGPGGKRGRWSRLRGGIGGLGAALAITLGAEPAFNAGRDFGEWLVGDPDLPANRRGGFFQRHAQGMTFGKQILDRDVNAAKRIMSDLLQGDISKEQAERRLRRLTDAAGTTPGGAHRVEGKVKVDVTVRDTNGKKKGTASVTADLFPMFRPKAPQTRGRDTTTRGDGH